MSIIPLLFRFLAATLFKRGELDITSSTFNPVKFFTVTLSILYIVVTLFVINKLFHVYNKLEYLCPGVVAELHLVDVEDEKAVAELCHVVRKPKK